MRILRRRGPHSQTWHAGCIMGLPRKRTRVRRDVRRCRGERGVCKAQGNRRRRTKQGLETRNGWEKDRRDQGETDEAYLEKLKPGSSGGGVARHATDESITGTSVAVFFSARSLCVEPNRRERLIRVFRFPAGKNFGLAHVGRYRVPGLVQLHDASASGRNHIRFGIRVSLQSLVSFE